MLKVTTEYLPNGSKKDSEILGVIAIVNTLEHPLRPLWGKYNIIAENKNKKHRFSVTQFERKNGAWCLVHNVMREICRREYKGICNKVMTIIGGCGK